MGINLFQLKEKYQNIIEKNDILNPNIQTLSSPASSTLSVKDLTQSFSSEFSSKPVLINQPNDSTSNIAIDDKIKEAKIKCNKISDNDILIIIIIIIIIQVCVESFKFTIN